MKNQVHHMDCIKFLKKLPDNSIDSCVTDSPYGLNFMGKAWDSGAISFDKRVWRLLFMKLKGGAHILVFGGARTYHRLATAIEDAGFEIRDMMSWVYGSGFPKGENISKAIDKSFGLTGKVVPPEEYPERMSRAKTPKMDITGGGFHSTTDTEDRKERVQGYQHKERLPVSPEAWYWYGWNTALKPAHEPIVLARKPLVEKTVIENVLKHGLGAINVDACRVEVNPTVDDMSRTTSRGKRKTETWEEGSGFKNESNDRTGVLPSGRYPANLILSHHPDCKLIQAGTTTVKDVSTHAPSTKMGKHGIYGDFEVPVNMRHSFDVVEPEIWECVEDCPIKLMNEQSGTSSSNIREPSGSTILDPNKGWNPNNMMDTTVRGFNDSGGAARFFYCPKPSEREKRLGLGEEDTKHVTMKPVTLMRYLVRLITPPLGTVVDFFLGSGTTAIAAEIEGFDWLGCDNNDEYCATATKRIEAWRKERC